MRVIFWGTPNYAIESLEKLNNNNSFDILAVVTQPDKRRSRGSTLLPSPIKKKALELGIKVFTPNRIKEDRYIQEQLALLRPDIYVVIAFGQILPTLILEQPKYGCWNAHGSLLPRWRGAAPIQWSLINGDNHTGVGIMAMEEGLDTGPIFLEEVLAIEESDDALTLSKKLSKLSASLLEKALIKIKNLADIGKNIETLNLTAQDTIEDRNVTYARRLEKTDYQINWNETSKNIINKIKGLIPYTYTTFKGKRIKIIKCQQYFSENYKRSSIAGTILGIQRNTGILISTKTQPLLVTSIQLEGKKIADGNSLIQQINAQVGESFI